jgi:uncharacterized membrane protein YeaQ/YmgE (transglycosylase-associated protein family)
VDLLVTLVTGGIIGWVASLIMGTDAEMGLLANVFIGVLGSLLGTWLAATLGLPVGGAARWLFALLGAAVLIAIVRALGIFRPRRA